MKKNNKILIVFMAIVLFLLVSCSGTKQVEIPDFSGMTLKEVVTLISDNKDKVNYVYLDVNSNNETNDNEAIFIKYEDGLKSGDKVSEGSKVKLYFSSEVIIPDLDGKDLEYIDNYFSDRNIDVNFIHYYIKDLNENDNNKFSHYKEGFTVGDFLKENNITIYLKSSKLILPDLEGLGEEEIISKFADIGLGSSSDIEIEFRQYFNPTVSSSDEEKFNSYGNDLKIGDTVKGNKVIVYLNEFADIKLPNIRNMNKEQIINLFAEMGIDEKYLHIKVSEYNLTVPPSTFIRYGSNLRPGNLYSPSTNNRLEIILDAHIELPNLEGFNSYQIKDILQKIDLTNIKYEYVTDNTKEHLSFNKYLDFNAGDAVKNNDEVVIEIYENDNLDSYEIMFSKYIYISGTAKGVELYNLSDGDIDLSDYYIALFGMNNLTPYESIYLVGTLKSKEKYLIINEGANEEFIERADLVTASIDFHALDSIQLKNKNNNTTFDIIYERGNSSAIFDEEIFVRREYKLEGSIMGPTNEFFVRDWAGFIPSYVEVLDSYPVNIPFGPEFELIPYIFPEYGMTEMKFISAADGDTVYFDSLDPRDTNNYKGDNRIRFLMVDTPETDKPGVVGQPYANVATTFTRTLLGSASKIYLQADKTAGTVETYGRTLGLIWFKIDEDISFNNIAKTGLITISKGWHLLNYELLKYGLGVGGGNKIGNYVDAPIYSNRYSYQWTQEAVFFAQANQYGLHSGVHRD